MTIEKIFEAERSTYCFDDHTGLWVRSDEPDKTLVVFGSIDHDENPAFGEDINLTNLYNQVKEGKIPGFVPQFIFGCYPIMAETNNIESLLGEYLNGDPGIRITQVHPIHPFKIAPPIEQIYKNITALQPSQLADRYLTRG